MIWDMPLLEGNMFFLNIVDFCEYLYSKTLRPWCLTLVPQLNWVGSIANCGSNSNYRPMQCVGTGCLTWCYLNKCFSWESSFITFLELALPVVSCSFIYTCPDIPNIFRYHLQVLRLIEINKTKITKTPQTEKLNLISNPFGSFSSRRSQGIDLCPESFSHLLGILCFRNTCCCGGLSPGCWNLENFETSTKASTKAINSSRSSRLEHGSFVILDWHGIKTPPKKKQKKTSKMMSIQNFHDNFFPANHPQTSIRFFSSPKRKLNKNP